MTIAALRALLDEELPHVVRPPAPRLNRRPLPSKDTAMNPPTATSQDTGLPDATLAELLFWAQQHTDPDVRAQGEQARTTVTALTERRRRDSELARVTEEAAELEERLAQLRARQAELQPGKPKKARRDYEPTEVRAWARAEGLPVPDRGQIPKAVMEAWRGRAVDPEGAPAS